MKERILGVDYGERRIGIAVSDPTNTYALPLVTIETPVRDQEKYRQLNETVRDHIHSQAQQLATFIRNYAAECPVERIVLGFPITLKEEIGLSARRVQLFIADLLHAIEDKLPESGIEITTIDESFTSSQADVIMDPLGGSKKRKQKRKDQIAAMLILNAYLDQKQR